MKELIALIIIYWVLSHICNRNTAQKLTFFVAIIMIAFSLFTSACGRRGGGDYIEIGEDRWGQPIYREVKPSRDTRYDSDYDRLPPGI